MTSPPRVPLLLLLLGQRRRRRLQPTSLLARRIPFGPAAAGWAALRRSGPGRCSGQVASARFLYVLDAGAPRSAASSWAAAAGTPPKKAGEQRGGAALPLPAGPRGESDAKRLLALAYPERWRLTGIRLRKTHLPRCSLCLLPYFVNHPFLPDNQYLPSPGRHCFLNHLWHFPFLPIVYVHSEGLGACVRLLIRH